MKFLKGVLFGSIAGFAAGTALGERQRRELIDRVRGGLPRRSDEIATTVRDGGDRVANAATGRIASEIDDASKSVAETLSST